MPIRCKGCAGHFPFSYRCGLWVPAQSQYVVPPGQGGCGAKGPSGESATQHSPRSPEPEHNLLEGSGTCAWRRRDSVSRMHYGAAMRCGAWACEMSARKVPGHRGLISRNPRITPIPSLSSHNMFGFFCIFFVGTHSYSLSLCGYPPRTCGRVPTFNHLLALTQRAPRAACRAHLPLPTLQRQPDPYPRPLGRVATSRRCHPLRLG